MSALILDSPAVPPRGVEQIRATYGDVKILKVGAEWKIVAPFGWESKNCELVRDFPGIDRPLYVNKRLVVPLHAALTSWQARCPSYAIDTIGCFCVRPKGVAHGASGLVGLDEGLSVHAFAAAVDINAKSNPMRKPMVCDMPAEFIACFTDAGFTHGASFPTPDPMHFQLCSGY